MNAADLWVPIETISRTNREIKQAQDAGDHVRAATLQRWLKGEHAKKAKRRKNVQNRLMARGLNPDMVGQPTVKFLLEAAIKRDKGQITQAEYKHFAERVLPSMTGQLGASLHPRYQKFAQWAQTYQSWRLLPFALFSSFMDTGVMIWNTDDMRILLSSAKEALGKTTRDQVQELGEWIGVLNTWTTEHYLNNNMGMDQNHLTTASKWGELIFRLNGMHQYTEGLRKVSMLAAQRVFIQLANKGDPASLKRLKQYGLEPGLVKAYTSKDGNHLEGLMDSTEEARQMGAAINQFVNESVMRPDVATRPWWATHPVGKVVFFLKGFMYQFQAVVIRKLWNHAKNHPGSIPRKTAHGLLAMLPMIAATLPLTMLGYELRRQVGTLFDEDWFEHLERDGAGEYMKEMIRRSGYLGVGETVFMMEDDRARGSSALNALLGPTGGQILDGLSGGVLDPSWYSSSLPVVPVIPALRGALP